MSAHTILSLETKLEAQQMEGAFIVQHPSYSIPVETWSIIDSRERGSLTDEPIVPTPKEAVFPPPDDPESHVPPQISTALNEGEMLFRSIL
jgi:hypothetical protein